MTTPGDSTNASRAADAPAGRSWRRELAPYARPRPWRSIVDILTSAVAYLALWPAMYLALEVSYWLVLALAVPASGFLLRTFIVFHDCTHGSFFASKRANQLLGSFCGLLVFAPFANWRHDHAVHHGTSGDLDRRGVGDVPTLTVAEYYGRSFWGRLGYRLFRSPAVMFGLGSIYSLVIAPRLSSRAKRKRLRRSIAATNVALLVLITGVCLLIGWREFLLIQAPMVFLAGTAGVWLFYVQHQFEDAYWQRTEDWDYDQAALQGSSYLKLPKLLEFFTGNIGYHHVHHLSARIPNYNLPRAHEELPVFDRVPVLTLRDGLRAVRLKLYDEQSGRLVTFAQARQAMLDARAGGPARA